MTHTTRTIGLLFFGLFGLGMLLVYINTDTEKQSIPEPVVVEKNEASVPLADFTVYENRVKNALITVPDTNVKISLVDGRASYGTNLDGGDVTLIKIIGGEKFSSTVTHLYANIAVQSGGTGVFHYVGLFEVKGDTVTHLSSHFIGDRVSLGSARVVPKETNTYTLTVAYLDRREDDALVAEPTVAKEVNIEVKNGLFVENSL